ncbi:NAD(P)H-dependent FMN reductase [Peribacillus sp. B2I2]
MSYGSTGGARAAEHLRGILGELLVADVRVNPTFSLFTDFENYKTFKPADLHLGNVHAMLDQTIAWSSALKKLR